MITKRHRNDRGPTLTGWLKSLHSFSFGHYMDPDHMGFGPLRVINEDRVIPGAGFGTHPHNNMEIISYVLSGELAHEDSMGHGSVIRPGDIQLMSAGTGITHSEFNNSGEEEVHFLQIWIMPDVQNTTPEYKQKTLNPADLRNRLYTIVSPDGENGSLIIKQDARLLAGQFEANTRTSLKTDFGRKYWLQMASGMADLNGQEARAGDGFAITGEKMIGIRTYTDAHILLFDLPV